ncbi:MAG TPA: hypothetical protein VGF38_02955 [Ktedonobacterales bacterium]|jgi:hypothetical protein
MSLTSDTSQPMAPACALGLTSADLSAWRDEALAPDETSRIGAHSEGCPACQERLRGFEAIAATLQAQRVPVPDGRLWQAVFAALSTGQRTTNDDTITGEYLVPDQSGNRNPISQSPTPPRSWRGRALGTLAAVAAIALVVVGFGQLFQSGASNRPQPFQLHWRQISLPGGMGKNLTEGTALTVFPANGSVAWICQSGTEAAPGPLRIWRTTNAETTWRSVEAPQLTHAFDCEIQLDQLNPDVAVLDLDAFVHPPQSQAQHATYITFDGGASWHDAPFFDLTGEFATLNGAIYAIRPDNSDANRLEISRDGAQTWNYVDDAIHAQKLMPTQFWANPNTGMLLVQAISMTGDGLRSLWTVDVSGNSWRSLMTVTNASVIASPATDGHWNMCSILAGPHADPKRQNIYPYHIYCGTDATSQWTTRPALGYTSSPGGTIATPCSGCIQVPSTIGQTKQLAIANDGAVIIVFVDRFDSSGAPIGASLYRLPAGSSTWQNGGALPIGASAFGATQLGSTVIFTPRPGGGMLWAMPDQDHGSHTGPVFTTSYPGPATQPLPTKAQQTPTPAGNVDQGAPLAWQPIANPAGFQPRLTSANILAVAPSDGRTAYACAQPNADPPAAPLRGWVTHDGGATWSTLPLPQVAGWCSLVVDEVNPRDVLLGFSHNPPAGGTTLPDLYYRSTDGGANWQDMPTLDGSVVYQFAARGSAIYALRVTNPLSDTATAELQASGDGMATWRAVDGSLHSGQSGVGQFWLNPYNGELLATNVPSSTVTTTSSTMVWRSSDGGAHWSDLKAPAYGLTSVIVRPPQPNHAWDICVSDFTASPTTAPSNLLYCGDDSGQGRHDVTALDIGDATTTPHYTAFTSDGSLLAISMATTGSGATTYDVYRLPSGASRWQALGPTPEFSLLYASTADGDGMLWSVPVNGISSPINGISSDAQGRVFAVAAP